MSKKILVTGGAGFIGSHVTQRLMSRGDRVTILDDFNDFYDPARKRANVAAFDGNVEIIEADIRDRETIDSLFKRGSFDGVIHLAARAGVRPSLAEPVLYEEVNCIGTLHLLEAARHHGPAVFTFGSSSSVYGINSKVPFSEDDVVNQPISPYATTKRTGELLCFNYHHLYDLRVSCLRFFTVYGPAQRPEMAIHKFTDLLANGRSVPLFGNGQSRRDYTYVDDIVDGVVAALDLAPAFEIFNLGGAETTRLGDLVNWIAEELGVEPRIERLPDQPGDVPITYADISKATRMLAYAPKVQIRQGLRQFIDWYRHKGLSIAAQ
ncbi:MAG: GDP-mannose 4,6-dehydratase [Acidobacteriota bacterium]|nr:GDP-mannose 4,6-dehydratase [Acidobacteriota bacterium]